MQIRYYEARTVKYCRICYVEIFSRLLRICSTLMWFVSKGNMIALLYRGGQCYKARSVPNDNSLYKDWIIIIVVVVLVVNVGQRVWAPPSFHVSVLVYSLV